MRILRSFAAVGFALMVSGASSPLPAQYTLNWYLSSGLPGENSGSVWGTSTSNLFLAGGYRGFGQWNGTAWSAPALPPSSNRYTVFGFSPTEVYSSGQYGYQTGALLKYDGSNWSPFYTAGSELTGLWGRSSSDLFTSGDGILRHFDGTNWTDIPTGLSTGFNVDRLESISGGATRTFVAGRNGTILSWDGSTLVRMATGTTVGLNSISALDDNTAFAVGGGGTILRYDGQSWVPMASPTSSALNGVFALSATSVYATSATGDVLYFDGQSWQVVLTGINRFLGTPFALTSSEVYIPVASGTGCSPSCSNGMLLSTDASLGGSFFGSTTVAPEPSTVALLAIGLVGLSAVLRRRVGRA
jgi:hypothetical protein